MRLSPGDHIQIWLLTGKKFPLNDPKGWDPVLHGPALLLLRKKSHLVFSEERCSVSFFISSEFGNYHIFSQFYPLDSLFFFSSFFSGESLTFCGVTAAVGPDSFVIKDGNYGDSKEFRRMLQFLDERFPEGTLRDLRVTSLNRDSFRL